MDGLSVVLLLSTGRYQQNSIREAASQLAIVGETPDSLTHTVSNLSVTMLATC